jgi:hypothetical protein
MTLLRVGRSPRRRSRRLRRLAAYTRGRFPRGWPRALGGSGSRRTARMRRGAFLDSRQADGHQRHVERAEVLRDARRASSMGPGAEPALGRWRSVVVHLPASSCTDATISWAIQRCSRPFRYQAVVPTAMRGTPDPLPGLTLESRAVLRFDNTRSLAVCENTPHPSSSGVPRRPTRFSPITRKRGRVCGLPPADGVRGRNAGDRLVERK